jgi:hypothetical protein
LVIGDQSIKAQGPALALGVIAEKQAAGAVAGLAEPG